MIKPSANLDKFDNFPLITIGVTCYNAADTISRAIDSALSQDWSNFEILVVDDGSTDGSQEIVRKRADADTRINLIENNKNLGCSSARNRLVENAKGEFLAFFDDDDVSSPERVRLQFEHIEAYEQKSDCNLIACFASGQRVYPNKYIFRLRAVGSDGPSPVGDTMADYLLFHKRDPAFFYGAGTPSCSLMARTLLFRKLGGFDPALRRQEDVDFAIRLGLMGGHFIGIPEPVLTQYATGGDEKSAQVEFESFIRILEKNAAYLKAADSYQYMRIWSEMRYRHFSGQDGHAFRLLTRLLFAYPKRTARHFLHTATRRFRHERRINASSHV